MYLKKTFLLFVIVLFTTSYSLADTTMIIPTQKINQSLHKQLPKNILNSGKIVVVNDGHYPPYIIFSENNKKIEGASIDLTTALGEILGVTIKHEEVAGLPALLMGVASKHYDMAIGPIADTPERRKNIDFIDFVQEYTALTVLKGNPSNIQSYNDLCGKRVAIQGSGNAEKRLIAQSEACILNGKPAVEITRFKDQTTPLLAVRSNRADAMSSPASTGAYYIAQSKGELELVPVGLRADFPYPKAIMGAFVAKDTPLGSVLLAAFQELFDNGTYMAIMKKWGLEGNALAAPGINLAK